MNYQILEHPINEANKLDIQYSLLDKELQESVVVEDESLYEQLLSSLPDRSEEFKRYFNKPDEKGIEYKLTFDMVLNEITGQLNHMIYFTLRRCLNKLDLKEDSESLVTSSIDLNKKDGHYIKIACTNESTLDYLKFLLYSENGIESHIENWISEIVEKGHIHKKVFYPNNRQEIITFGDNTIGGELDFSDGNFFSAFCPKVHEFFNLNPELRVSKTNN